MTWDTLQKVTGVIVNVVVVLGALGAGIKFRLLNVLGRRWQSDLICAHWELPDSSVVFAADYHVTNTGLRPLQITEVRIALLRARQKGLVLEPDPDGAIAERILRPVPDSRKLTRMCDIQPGEFSIFTLRVKLQSLDDIVFVDAGFTRDNRPLEGGYLGMYVKATAPSATTGDKAHTSAKRHSSRRAHPVLE